MPVVQLDLDSKDAVNGLKQFDNAVNNSEKNTTSAFDKMKDSVGTIALAAGAAATAVTASLIAIGASALDTASRMQEATNKFGVVFEGLDTEADAWRQNLTDNFHVSELAATKYLANTKAILDATGMQSKEAGELSSNMVQLALDLASFSDVPIADAIEATTAALTGEMEMMKRFGIVIKAEEVTKRAMIDNNYRTADSITEADKAQAAYNIMLEKGAKAIGDVERSGASYVTQLNDLRALQENFLTSIGSQLIPIATQAVTIFNQWAGGTNAVTSATNMFNTAMQYAVTTVQFLYNGFQGLVMIGNTLVVGFAFMAKSVVEALSLIIWPLEKIGEGLVKLGMFTENPFGAVTAGLQTLTTATETFYESSKKTFNEHKDSVEKTNKAFDDLKKTINDQRIATDGSTEALDKNAEAMRKSNKAADDLLTSTVKGTEGLKEYGNVLDMMEPKGEGYVRAASQISKMTAEQAANYTKLYSAAESARTAYEKAANSLNTKSTPAARQYAEALKKISQDADLALKEHEKLKPAVDKVAASMTTAAAKVDTTGDTVVRTTTYIRDNAAANEEAAKSYDRLGESARAAGDKAEAAANKWNPGGGNLASRKIDMGGFDPSLGLTSDQWDSMSQETRDRLSRENLLNNSSTWDWFNSPTGQRIKGVDNATQIRERNKLAYDFEMLKQGNASSQSITMINNFTQSMSRSDIENLLNELQRSGARA